MRDLHPWIVYEHGDPVCFVVAPSRERALFSAIAHHRRRWRRRGRKTWGAVLAEELRCVVEHVVEEVAVDLLVAREVAVAADAWALAGHGVARALSAQDQAR